MTVIRRTRVVEELDNGQVLRTTIEETDTRGMHSLQVVEREPSYKDKVKRARKDGDSRPGVLRFIDGLLTVGLSLVAVLLVVRLGLQLSGIDTTIPMVSALLAATMPLAVLFEGFFAPMPLANGGVFEPGVLAAPLLVLLTLGVVQLLFRWPFRRHRAEMATARARP